MLDDNLKNKIIDLYTNGLSALKIQKQLNCCSIGRIYQILKNARVTRSISESDKLHFTSKYPVKYDMLYDMYVNQQLTISEISQKLTIRKDIVRRLLLRYQIALRTTKEHFAIPRHKEAMINRVTEIGKTDKFKKKISRNSIKMWSDRNYKLTPNQLKIMHSDEYRQKMRKMMLERIRTGWGETIRPLISAGLIKCWATNVNYRNKIVEILHKNMDKNYENYKKWRSCIKEHATNSFGEFRKNLIGSTDLDFRIQNSISKTQVMLYHMLSDLKIKFEPEYKIGYYLFDCFLPDYNILIEVQGDYWHSMPKNIRNDNSKATYIERYFPQYKLKYLWEHEFKCKDRIIDLLKYWTGTNTEQIDYEFHAIKEDILSFDAAKTFLEKFHYINKIGNNSIRLGYFLQDKLIATIVYGNVVRDETATRFGFKSKDVLELSRLCIHPLYQKKNLGSYLIGKSIRYIINNRPHVKLLVSFADSTFNHVGTIYKASNWILDGVVAPSYWYVDTDGYVMHKKTLWNHANSLKLSEKDFANRYNYTKVNGKEKYRYIYHLS